MSSHKTLTISATVVVVGALYYFSTTSPTSVSREKANSLRPQDVPYKMTAKLALGVQADIQMLTEEVLPGKEFEVQIKVSRTTHETDFRYELSLPADVQLLSGQSSGPLDLSGENEPELKFRFTQSADNNRKITLLIGSADNKSQKAFVFSTLDFHEEKLQQVELNKRRDEYHNNMSSTKSE